MLGACPRGSRNPTSNEEKGSAMSEDGAEGTFRDLTDRFWEGLLEHEPLLGTEIGDERYDDRLPDPSDQGLAERKQFHQAALDDLEAIDRGELSDVSRMTADVLEAIVRRELDSIAFRTDRYTAVSHLWGPSELLGAISSLQRADSPERLDRYIGRLDAMPAYLTAIAHVAEEAARQGLTAPAVVVDRTIAQVERLVATDPAKSPGVKPVPESQAEERERVVGVLRETVWPAYQGYLEMLRRYRPSARDTVGMSELPDGDAMYASQIRAWTTMPLEAQAVHDIGREDLAKIQEERREIAERLGFPDAAKAIEDHQSSGRNTAASREEMVKLAEDQVQRGWDAAWRYFGRLPDGNCEVRPVEEFMEKDAPSAFYYPPSGDNSRRGIYYINTSDLDQRPLHHVASTTYHEANPGHHFQISIEQEFTDRPALRRFGGILAGSAFIEGWGLYSERLAEEMGLFVDDYERLGMLDAQGWRAARLIVDTGIHALGWDRDRAVAQLEEAGVPRMDAEIETDRYITNAGQALAYKIGQHEIEKWRAQAAHRDGSKFSLSGFHDRLLALGALPLSALERELSSG